MRPRLRNTPLVMGASSKITTTEPGSEPEESEPSDWYLSERDSGLLVATEAKSCGFDSTEVERTRMRL
jgi:hypothetical protein